MNYMSPRSDVGFKKLFGNEHHKKLTISFLNSILERKKGELICSISFIDTEKQPELIEGKRTYLDIHAIDEQGSHFIIEMQNKYQPYFIQRSQFYSSLVFSRQLNSAFDYDTLVPVILLGVLNHELYPEDKEIITHHTLMNINRKTITSMYQTFHFVELPKFKKTIDQLHSDIDQWLFFMKHADAYDRVPTELQKSKELIEAFHVLEQMQWTQGELTAYVKEMDNAGREDRIAQGAQERGIAQGITQGKYQEKMETAMHLIKKGMDLNFIIEVTGLTEQEISLLHK